MIDVGSFLFHDRRVRALALVVLTLWGAYAVSGWILAGATDNLIYTGLAAAAFVALLSILNRWQTGVYLFVGWLLFEDLARKFMGNNMILYFGKDVLVGAVYLSFFAAVRRKEVSFFRPKFLLPLLLFFWFGVLQVFNPASPSFAYGLLGLKLYFYYIPLVFIGYSLVDSEVVLRRFLLVLLALAGIVAGLGVAQAILGPSFLNPATTGADIARIINLYRVAPISGSLVYRPTSVFVSPGRFAFYLVPAWLFAFGAVGYLLMRGGRGRLLASLTMGLASAAIALSGSRGALLWTLGSALVCGAAFLWGAPRRRREGMRVIRALQRALLFAGIGVLVLVFAYPEALAARMALYSETLSPSSPATELVHRLRDYPLQNFLYAFDYPRWPYGYGIGTASLGGQYVGRFLQVASPAGAGVENGYGNLIVEMGILGLALWIVMSVGVVWAAWKAAQKLKGSPWFPIGFVIFWYSFLLLIPMTYNGIQPYQDFVMNSHLWLLLGMLFRLPSIAPSAHLQGAHSVRTSLAGAAAEQ